MLLRVHNNQPTNFAPAPHALPHFVCRPTRARPARTWFQTEREKKATRDAAKAGGEGRGGAGAAPAPPPGAKAGAAKPPGEAARAKKREALKGKRAAEAADAKRRRGGPLMEETAGAAGRARGAKTRARELVQQGVPASKASKIAAAAVAGARGLGGGRLAAAARARAACCALLCSARGRLKCLGARLPPCRETPYFRRPD